MIFIQNGHLMVLELDISRHVRVVIALLTISQSTGSRVHGRLVLLKQVLIAHGGWWDSLITLTPLFINQAVLNHKLAAFKVWTLTKSVCLLSSAFNEFNVVFV